MKIRTIGLIVFLVLGLLAVPLPIEAQQARKVFRVGMLSARNPRSIPPFVAFIQSLREHGYVEGENLIVEFRNAQGKPDRLPDLAAELVRLKVDVIVAFGPEITLRAASRATNTIPVVALAVNYDPMAKGYIDSFARPGGNITGAFFMQRTLAGKSLELLKETLPKVTRVFVLYDVHSADQLSTMAAAAQTLGLQLQSFELRNPPYDFESAMAAAVQAQTEALTVLGSPHFFSQRIQIAALTVKHHLPAMFPFRHWVELGGLMSYGASLSGMYGYGATYVDKILKGANPANLPVEQPTTFELAINLKTAKQIGVTIPPLILYQATRVIQ